MLTFVYTMGDLASIPGAMGYTLQWMAQALKEL